MISAGVEGRLPYMTYPEPWRGPPKQQELFLRPAPKPLPNSRYNGVPTSSPNGRLVPPPARPISKYPSPPTIPVSPVNLAQGKDEPHDDISPYSPYRGIFHPPYFSYPLYPPQQQQTYMMGRNFSLPPTPMSPMEPYSPTISTPSSNGTFLLPPSTAYSPPSSMKSVQNMLRDKRTPPHTPTLPPFKVPSGKEGSLKHRILTRPEDSIPRNGPLDLQKAPESRKRLQATMSPPRSPKKTLNNNAIPGNFAKGSLIQLANGDLRRIEDMRTEDFVTSADLNPELRLAESTVVKIEENRGAGTASITLSYNQRRAQVQVESTVEHPYFVMGRGWASCHPDRSQQCYGLSVHALQVGDVLISLTPREAPAPRVGTTILTTATSTPITSKRVHSPPKAPLPPPPSDQPINLQYAQTSPDRKRRWSAPDDICDDEITARRPKMD